MAVFVRLDAGVICVSPFGIAEISPEFSIFPEKKDPRAPRFRARKEVKNEPQTRQAAPGRKTFSPEILMKNDFYFITQKIDEFMLKIILSLIKLTMRG